MLHHFYLLWLVIGWVISLLVFALTCHCLLQYMVAATISNKVKNNVTQH